MKRSRFARRSGLSRDAESLLRLATGLAESGSRAEDRFWESQLTEVIDRLLEENEEAAFNDALDHLLSSNPRAYDELADYIESRAETALRSDKKHDILLIAAPLLSWSRFRIPPPASHLRASPTCGSTCRHTYWRTTSSSPSPTSCSAPTSCRRAVVQPHNSPTPSVRPRSNNATSTSTRPCLRKRISSCPTPATCWRPSRFPGRGTVPLATAGLFARTRPGAVAGAGRRLRGPDAARLCA